jgi:hypothetical protein
MRPRRFLAALVTIYATLMVAIAVNYAVLWRAEELLSIDEILARQRHNGALYNALSIAFADYKYAAYRAAAPRIVAIGTSRAMQIRQHDFLVPFYNLGGLTQGPAQANVLAERLLLRGRPPEVVIFALDYWTFCRSAAEPADQRRPAAPVEFTHDGMGQPARHFLAYQLLLERRFAVGDYERLLLSPPDEDRAERIGLGARLGTSGFAVDGSIYVAPQEGALQERWSQAFDRIAAGTAQFIKDCAVSDFALEALASFVQRMEAAGSHVVLMLAPLSGIVIERLEAEGRYGYINELRSVLTARHPHQFDDFLDMRAQAPDSEFLDGLHGGEVVYMRIILALAQRPGSPLRGLVNEQELAAQIHLWSGYSQVPTDPINRMFFSVEGR